MLLALIKTVAATTGAQDPEALTSQRELVAWVHAAITHKSERDVRAATKHGLVQTMDVAILAQSLEVISKLTALTSMGPATDPPYETCV